MRTLLALIIIPCLSIISLPLMLIYYIIGFFNEDLSVRLVWRFLRFFSRVLLFVAGGKITVRGLENIPAQDSILFVSNHLSYFDIPTLLLIIDRPIAFVAKDSLNKIPMLNIWLNLLGCLLLDRKSSRNALKTFLKGIDKMKNGKNFVVFPEGTRNKSSEKLLDFKKGSLKLAEKSDASVVPLSIYGTNNLFENNKGICLKASDIYVNIGKDFKISQLDIDKQKNSGKYLKCIVEDLLNDSLEKINNKDG